MFYQANDFIIQNSTFNDVAGNQVINTYHNSQIIKIESSRSGRSMVDPSKQSISLPTSEPFKSFIALAGEIQRALFPIGSFIDEPSLFDPLKDELVFTIKSTAFLGRILELVEGNSYFPSLFGSETMNSRISMYSASLRRAADEIRRYQEGLKFTLIGPIWRRVMWSVMWTMSADADIESIINTIRRDLDDCRVPLMAYLRKLREHVWWKAIRVLPDNVVSSLEILSADISKELPSIDRVELRHVLIDFGISCRVRVPLSSCATYKNLEIFFRYASGHTESDIQCFIDSSDGRVIRRSRFHELVTSNQTNQELIFIPVWSDNEDLYFESRDEIR